MSAQRFKAESCKLIMKINHHNTVTTSNGTGNNDQSTAIVESSLSQISIAEAQSEGFDRLTPIEVYLRSSAHRDGYDLTIKSNDFRINLESEEKLGEKWQKVANEANQGVFNATANLHDKHYHEEFVQNDTFGLTRKVR